MKRYQDLKVLSKELEHASLNDEDLDIVKYAVAHRLIADLNDKRMKSCEGAINGIYHALMSQGRGDLNKLIEYEISHHSSFEMV